MVKKVESPLEVLLVEDSLGDVRLLQEALRIVPTPQINLTHVATLDEAIQAMDRKRFDVALVDLSLPDSSGLETYQRIHVHSRELPIVVLSGESDPEIALKAVQAGAQDFFVKGSGDSNVLVRAMQYAIQRTRTEEELRRTQERLRQATKMEALGTMAGGIAHDFNNILCIIVGCAEVGTIGLPEHSEIRRYFEDIIDASVRGRELVKQILAFSRPAEQHRGAVDVHDVVTESLRLLRSTLPSTIELRLSLDRDVGMVSGDSIQMQQVVMNLCNNAEHAMRGRTGVLDVRLDVCDLHDPITTSHGTVPPGSYIRLVVRDTGCGMTMATIDRMFDPFFTTKTSVEGTGLGLAIVHGIVSSNHGTIDVDSAAGVGTTVTLYFPKNTEYDEKPVAQELFSGSISGRILIVDDERAITESARMMLMGLGCEVVVKNNGPDALAAFRAQPDDYDIVITDQAMPEMPGNMLITELRNIRSDIPTIVWTGYSQVVDEGNAAEIGANAFLMKPFTRSELVTAIQHVLPGRA